MSERTIASGSDFMCFERTGVDPAYTYKPIAGQTNCTLQRGTNYRESSAKNLGGYKDFFKGLKDWTASVDVDIVDPADVNADELSFEELEDYEIAGTKPTFVFAHITVVDDEPEIDTTKPMYAGKGLVSCPRNAPSGDNQTSTIAIQGCVKLEKINPA